MSGSMTMSGAAGQALERTTEIVVANTPAPVQANSTETNEGATAARSQRAEPPASDAVLERLARQAHGLVGADIERIVREARGRARREKRDVTFDEISVALMAAKPKRSRAKRHRIAVHEAGHAVAFIICFGTTPKSVSVDHAGGGLIEADYPAERMEGVLSDVEHDLSYMLAGRAAEEVLLGSVAGGSGGGPDSDLGRATTLAARMEGAFGWGGENQLLYYGDEALALRLNGPAFAARVHGRLERAYAQAKELVTLHKAAVERLAAALVEKGSLEGGEIRTVADLGATGAHAAASEGAGS